MNEIIYTLIATVDGVEVCNQDFPDTTELQELGLRRAEDQVERYMEMEDEDE